VLAYYGNVVESLAGTLTLFFGTLMAGKILLYGVRQLGRF